MRRFARRSIPAVLLVVLYLLWQPLPVRKELVVEARWAVDPATAVLSPPQPGPSIPVSGPDRFAYLSETGAVTYRGIVAHRVAMSADAFLNHPRTTNQLIVQDRAGEFVSSLPVSGHPFFLGERLFVVSDGGGTLSEWSREGSLRWRVQLPAPLTAIEASATLVAVGTAAGGAMLLGADGTPMELQRPTAASEPVVYSVAVSEAVPRLAVVAGGGSADATLTLYDLASGRGTPVVRRRITRNEEVTPLVELTAGGRSLVYAPDAPRQIVRLDPESGEEWIVPVNLPARELAELPFGFSAVLGVSTDRDPSRAFALPAELTLVAPSGAVPVRAAWAANASGIRVHESLLLIELDGRVLAVEAGVEQ